MPDVHVVPQASRWGLEVDGDIRSTHGTQEEAISQGRGLAEQEQGELVIHGEKGQIREKDSHKHGGWRTYGVFKNQGDCVSFVATGGKNPPAGARP
jgi:hypothetical protein